MTLYLDDNTGLYYYWDGSKFARYTSNNNGGDTSDKSKKSDDNSSKNKGPQIGDRGSKSIQDEEEKERQAQIEKERAEAGEDGESEEEREKAEKARIQRIKNRMSDPRVGSNLDADIVKASQKERELQRKIGQKNASKYAGGKGGADISKFKKDFEKFIADQVAEVEIENQTWSRQNRRYVGSPFIMPGTRKDILPGPVPSVRVYFDWSGSWDNAKISVGKQVIESITNEYVAKKKLILDIRYFNSDIMTELPPGSKEGFGGTRGTPIMNDIKKYKPDNVIIMTDSDITDITSPVKVPGGVFLLFKDGVSQNLIDHIKGKKLTRSYEIS